MRTTSRRGRLLATSLLVPLAALLAFGSSVGATPPSNDPHVGAQAAAHWEAGLVNAQGYVPGPGSSVNISSTLEVAIGLADVGTESSTFARIHTWLVGNVETVVTNGGGADNPGNIGWLLMIAKAAGDDPTNVGGVDLVTRLNGTLDAFATGLYGADDPTYDGTFRQSLALLGLAANGITPPPAAVNWLVGQQCNGAVAAAAGGWEPFRADASVPCVAPDPNTFAGPDTNSTAMAVQALVALGVLGPVPGGLDFLAAAESPAGGFAFIPGGDDDPNSNALVLQAIVAGGEDPSAGRWVKGAATPVTAMLSWQLGCAATADVGALTSPFSNGSADSFATIQGVWGLQGAPFPVAGPVTFHAAVDPCAPATTTTTSTTVTSTTTAVAPVAAAPVAATPSFTG